MTYRNANYAAFYVDERQMSHPLAACFAKDFCYYQLLKMWKRDTTDFPFIDAHSKTYIVRDESDWETTLKPRLHERLRMSKNIILILSDATKQSKALREEITYGVDKLDLPVIVMYPDFAYVGRESELSEKATARWEKLPCLKSRIGNVPTAHIPFKKDHLEKALKDPRFSVCTKTENCTVGLNTDYERALNEIVKQLPTRRVASSH